MSRRLQFFNLIGVVALAGLCVFQWRADRRLNLEVGRLEKMRIDNEQKIIEQQKTADGLGRDLAFFKEQFNQAHTDLAEVKGKLREEESLNERLQNERDQLRESITNWTQAVAERDARLKEANERIGELADKLNGAIRKYNELASNYNGVVGELNATRPGDSQKK